MPVTRWAAIRLAFASYVPPEPEAWFWDHIDKDGPVPPHKPELGPCWVWTLYCHPTGYGQVKHDSVQRFAHRTAWELEHGPIPAGGHVLHHCDHRPCAKAVADEHGPAHLFLGTPKDNVADMIFKGRQGFDQRENRRRGEANHNAKLTESDVIEMRLVYRTTRATQPELARAFGVSHALVSYVVTGRAWAHVPL